MSESTVPDKQIILEEHTTQLRQEPSFHYQMVDMKARKIVTLIKFSKLPYSFEEVTEAQTKPFLLRTKQGQLYEEYEIIGYIVNDSFVRGGKQNGTTDGEEELVSLCGTDIFTWAKMNQHLFELRRNLFPMLDEFYRYFFGHEKVKKSKYQALGNKIRKQILKLDHLMGQHSEIYRIDFSYLNIIIFCELFIACRFIFQEKFRKSKLKLFSKCQKIFKSQQFEQVYGKCNFCSREALPAEFEDEDEPQTKKEEAIHIQLAKLAEPWTCPVGNQKRNELLYNFFKNTLKGHQSKLNYFPYYWLMHESLLCTLVQLHYDPTQHGDTYSELQKSLVVALQQLGKVIKLGSDYGFLGIYLNQKDRRYRLQGLVCLSEISYEQFTEQMSRNNCLKRFKPIKVDVTSEEEKRKVEMLWQYQNEGMSFEGIKVSLIREF